MTEQTPEPTPPTPGPDPAQGGDQQQQPPEDTTDWKAEARKWEQRAKENRKAAADAEKELRGRMSDSDKAIAEAEDRGRKEAIQKSGTRLAQTEFGTLAARRNPAFSDDDLKAVLEYVDLSKMVGEDGEPDVKALEAAVTRLVPEPKEGAPTFDGGTRTPPQQTKSFGDVLRKEIQGRR